MANSGTIYKDINAIDLILQINEKILMVLEFGTWTANASDEIINFKC